MSDTDALAHSSAPNPYHVLPIHVPVFEGDEKSIADEMEALGLATENVELGSTHSSIHAPPPAGSARERRLAKVRDRQAYNSMVEMKEQEENNKRPKHERETFRKYTETEMQQMDIRDDTKQWKMNYAAEKRIQESNNLFLLFKFYGVNQNDCETFFQAMGIEKPSDLSLIEFPRDFEEMREIHNYGNVTGIVESIVLEDKIQRLFNEFKSFHFDFKEFKRIHMPPPPVRRFRNCSRPAEDMTAEELAACAWAPLPQQDWEPETLPSFLQRMQYGRDEKKEIHEQLKKTNPRGTENNRLETERLAEYWADKKRYEGGMERRTNENAEKFARDAARER